MRRTGYLIALLALSAPLPAPGQDDGTNSPPASVCQTAPGFADFDFWVGEWNVYSNDGQRSFQGTNSITKHHGDCLIKESWTSRAGNGGFSINYFNAVTDEWRQVWVANGYSIDYTGGLNDAGAMVLEGNIFNYRGGHATAFRGIWTPQPDASVIQRFEIHDADTDAWSVWFEGLYVRQENDSEGPATTP